jgi:hypothetical protein
MDRTEWAHSYEDRLHPLSQLLAVLLEATGPTYEELLDSMKRSLNLNDFGDREYLRIMQSLEEQLDNWDRYFLVKQMIPALKSTLARLGYRDIVRQTTRRNLRDRSRDQFGQTFPVDPPTDIRVLVNLYKDSLQAYRILFHEYGHVLHYSNIDASLNPLLRYDQQPVLAEGLAQVIESLVLNDKWLATHTSMSAEQRRELRQTAITFELFRFRRECVFSIFEDALYLAVDDGEKKLNDIKSYLNRRFLLFENTDGDHVWLDRSAQLIRQPVTAYQWPLALVIREHILGSFYELDGDSAPERFRSMLEGYYGPGKLYDWMELIQTASGKSLNPIHTITYFLQLIGRYDVNNDRRTRTS